MAVLAPPSSRPWFAPIGPRRPQAVVRLIGFPHAGGNSSLFVDWPPFLPGQIEMWAAVLPGRDRAFQERPWTSARELAQQLASHIDELPGGAFAFFGHSMGALVAFETCRALRRAGRPLPAVLLVASCAAPTTPPDGESMHGLPDAILLEELRLLQGTAPELFADREFMELLLPILRADLALTETYRCEAEAPLSCPISVYGGAGDDRVSAEALAMWKTETSAGFRQRSFTGGHFWLRQPAGLLAALTRDVFEPPAR